MLTEFATRSRYFDFSSSYYSKNLDDFNDD